MKTLRLKPLHLGSNRVLAYVNCINAFYGKISDIYGRRIVFQFAIVTFLIGSFAAGAAQNMAQLIGTRAMQGLGAGGLMALTFVIIGDIVPPRERGRYQGYFGAVWGFHQLPALCSVDSSQITKAFLA